MKNIRLGMGAFVAALALALGSGVASAQQKAPDAPGKAAAPQVEAPKAAAPKAAAPKVAAPKAATKVASACAGVEPEATCLGNTECMRVKEVVTKAGQKRKAHCQKKPTPPAAKKAAAPAASTAAKTATPAVPKAPAPKAAAPAAPAAPAPKN